jgi:hypothetical protein
MPTMKGARAARTLVAALLACSGAATAAAQAASPAQPQPAQAAPAAQGTSFAQAAVPDQAAPLVQAQGTLDRRQQFPPADETKLLTFNGILRSAYQGISRGEVAGERTDASGFGAGSFELALAVRPTPYLRVFVDAEGLAGRGPEQILGSLSRVNSDADQLAGAESKILLNEFWLRFAMANGKIRLSVGKLDPAHYFDRNSYAEDDTTQFMDDALLNDPMLKPPPNALGATLRFTVGQWRYAFGAHAPDELNGDLSGRPYLVAEVGRRNVLPTPGRWQWWVRTSSMEDDRARATWGTGVSIDQSITQTVGIFVRCGLSRREGETLTSSACAGGMQFTPDWWQRPKDRLGVGYTYQRDAAGSEKLVEAYWSVAVYKLLWLTADVQWLISGPNQEQGGLNRHVLVPGVRAALLF